MTHISCVITLCWYAVPFTWSEAHNGNPICCVIGLCDHPNTSGWQWYLLPQLVPRWTATHAIYLLPTAGWHSLVPHHSTVTRLYHHQLIYTLWSGISHPPYLPPSLSTSLLPRLWTLSERSKLWFWVGYVRILYRQNFCLFFTPCSQSHGEIFVLH